MVSEGDDRICRGQSEGRKCQGTGEGVVWGGSARQADIDAGSVKSEEG